MRAKLAALVPLTAGLGLRRAWSATIDFTPDHLPIIGPAADLSTGCSWRRPAGRA